MDGRPAWSVDARLLLGARAAEFGVIDAVAADAAVGRGAARAAAAAHEAPSRGHFVRGRRLVRGRRRRAVGRVHAGIVRLAGHRRREERDGREGHVGRGHQPLATAGRRDGLEAAPLLARLLFDVGAAKLLLVDARLARAAVDRLTASATSAAARLVAQRLFLHARRRVLVPLVLVVVPADHLERALGRQPERLLLARLEEELERGYGVEQVLLRRAPAELEGLGQRRRGHGRRDCRAHLGLLVSAGDGARSPLNCGRIRRP
mmetsp:Transcript_5564/g.14530  ORF Transcript_5564/g.14530 Transcript_5564/m.14530 type:complete len:262 (+) Transcript_5564:376-1161(+)